MELALGLAGLGVAIVSVWLAWLQWQRPRPARDIATSSGPDEAGVARSLDGPRVLATAVKGDASRQRPWMAPPLDRMVERPELGNRLLDALIAERPGEVGLTTGLRGAGGFGKTTLATWACHQPEIDQRYPGGLLWVTVGQESRGADLAGKINDLAFVVSGQRPAIADPDTAGAELGRLLRERGPILLVVDDVWEESQLRPFRFGAPACTRLVTTRIPDLLPGGSHIPVDAMSGDQARDLVVDGIAGLTAAAADRLATVAGRWPMLLNLVNGALRRRVTQGEEPGQAVSRIMQRLVTEGPAAFDPARPEERTRAVAATVGASLALLSPTDRQRYLDLAIFPEDVDIPMDVLDLLWSDCRVEALCEDLVGLGLVAEHRLDPPGPRLVLHDVMLAYLRASVSREDRADAHRRLIAAAATLLPTADSGQPTPWWTLPDDADYLWRHLPYHLRESGDAEQLPGLVCDLRWAEAKTSRLRSVVGAQADLELVDTPTAGALHQALQQAAHLLGPIDPPTALGATLASRLHGVPELEATLNRYRATLARPRMEPAWPFPRLSPSSTTPGLHTGSVTSCAFSPDGALLATTGDDGAVLVWHLADSTCRSMLAGHTGGVWDCAFSPDGTLLASASADGTARLWRIADGSVRAVLSHADRVLGCAFSPDGALLATASADGVTRLWHVATASLRTTLPGHADRVWGSAFSPDGALLATTSADGAARIWDVAKATLRTTLTGHGGHVTSCAFSPNGTLIATTGTDGTARIWETISGKERTTLTDADPRAWRCAFSPDGTKLAVVGSGGVVTLHGVAAGGASRTLRGHVGVVLGCAFSPDGALLATASVDQTIRLWRVADGTEHKVIKAGAGRVHRCEFSPDGTFLATTSLDGPTRLRRLPDGTTLAELPAEAGGRDCAFSPDGTLLATGGNDPTTRLWDVATGTLRATLTGHVDWVGACTFSPDGALLATASNDGTVRLWRVTDGDVHVVLTHSTRVNGCAFSPDGTLLATASDDTTVRLWQVADGAIRKLLVGHTDVVTRCAFSPDGALLATPSDDGTVRLWRMPDGTVHAVLTGHTSWAEVCVFSPDGRLLASGSQDGTVRIWRLTDGTCQCALRIGGHLGGLAWHPRGDILCAVGGAGTHLLTYLP